MPTVTPVANADSSAHEAFYIGSVRILPTEDGYWVYYRENRARYAAKGSPTANEIESGHQLTKLHDAQLRHAAGTHEPVAYFRDPSGKIGIPPSPDTPIPSNCIAYTANTLHEIDKLTAEMTADSKREWSHSQEFTDGLHSALGSPRDELLRRMSQTRSNKERDVISAMLAESDREDRDRANVKVDTRFRFREYDGGNI